jgi:hypothetical protein
VPRVTPRRWPIAACAALVGVLGGAGCASAPASAGARPSELAELDGIDERLVPRFQALRAAVLGHDDATARLLAARLRTLAPEGRAAELLRDFERVLDGRAEMARIELALAARVVPERPGELALELAVARGADGVHPGELVLEFPPPLLVRDLVWLAPSGQERRERHVEPLAVGWDALGLTPGERRTLALAPVEVELAGALALRVVFSLELHAGVAARIGPDGTREELPAAGPRCRPAEIVLLAQYLPPDAVDPGELARYALRPEISVPALMERAVRVDPARWGEALDAVAASAGAYPDQRLAELVPALRFIGRVGESSADPVAWRAWLAGAGRAGERGGHAELDLPDQGTPDRRTLEPR